MRILKQIIIIALSVILISGCGGRIKLSEINANDSWAEYGGNSLNSNNIPNGTNSGFELIGKLKLRSMVGKSVAANGNVIFCPTLKGMLQVFDLESGKQIGMLKIKRGLISSPAYKDSILYFSVAEAGKTLYGYHVRRGKYLWKKKLGIFESPLTVEDDKLFAANRNGTLFCIKAKTGEMLWDYNAGSVVLAGILVTQSKALVSTLDGKIIAVDVETGDRVWEYNSGMKIEAAPSSDGRSIFITSLDSRVISLDAETGRLLWSFDTGGAVHTTPAVGDNRIIFGCSDGIVYSLDSQTGKMTWKFDAGAVVNTACILINDKVYFGSMGLMLYGLDSVTGEVEWEYPTDAKVASNPFYVNHKLIFPVEHRFLYIYGIPEKE